MKTATQSWALGVAVAALVLSAGSGASAAPARKSGLQAVQTIAHVVESDNQPAKTASSGASNPIVPYFNNTDPLFAEEVEPNATSATATPMTLTAGRAVYLGNTIPAADIDVYSFTAAAGDRVFATTITTTSAAGTDTGLDLLASDGVTLIEADEANGSFAAASPSIAGATIPTAGTYFLRVRPGTTEVRPYRLYLQLRNGTPTAEVEPNETNPTATPLTVGYFSGALSAAADIDFFSLPLNAGDTVVFNLDGDPERDAVDWNPSIGIGTFNNFNLTVDDATLVAADPALSEVIGYTVATAGTYQFRVASGTSAPAATFGTYLGNVTVIPRPAASGTCTTYTSAAGTGIIPSPGQASATLTVPGNPRISDLNVRLVGTHANTPDLDVSLVAPGGNQVSLFTDVGNAVSTLIDFTLDDEAFSVPSPILANQRVQPESAYRLAWFDGQDAGGTWTLNVRDDTLAATGEITSFSIEVCEPPPVAMCAAGTTAQVVYTTDFETGDAGFTHAGTFDEWERGLPATVAAGAIAPFTTCNSGTNCWKTDLDNTYDASSNQDLFSPAIDLTGLQGPVVVRWAQRYQMENASFDHYNVDLIPNGMPLAAGTRLFDWRDATMSDTVGNPAVAYGEAAGWAQFVRTVPGAAGQISQLRFHVDSDTTVQLAGVAIDDVSVTACRALVADLAITKTNGTTTSTPGGTTTYTITASNPAGGDPVTGATVTDTFPAGLTCNTTCAGTGGGTCTSPIVGNINDTAVNLPAGASVTYTSVCQIAASATGTIANTATVAHPADTNPANNSATDTDTLGASANLGITKTNGTTTVSPGGSTTYTIVASNTGPSNAPGTTVTDTFPATLTCNTTCAGAGGATCTNPGAGNINQVVNLPVGGSVTYTAVCAVSASATGTIANTATVTAGAGVTDPTPANNSATDTDTVGGASANLGITKTDGVTTVTPGGSTTYTIVATNAGPANAPGTTVTDTFPATLTCTSTCVGAGGGTCTNPGAGNINQVVNLPVGGSVTFTSVCAVSPTATGTIANTATVATGGGITDPVPANNSATDTNTVGASTANLSITKTDGRTTATVGTTGSYTIVVGNAGPSAATATVNDTVPAGFTVSGFTCTGAGGAICPASGGASQVIAAPVTLPVGSTATFIVNGTYSQVGTVSNTATVTITPPGTDPVPANNTATDTTTVGSPAAVSGTKTITADPSAPGLIPTTMTIVLTNSGPGAQLDNPGNEFDDVLGQGFIFGSVTSTSGVVAYDPVTRTVSFNGPIAAGASVTITITGTINRFDVPGGTFSNQGTIRFDADGNGTNESTALTDDPSVPGPANPTQLVLGSGFVPVPALGRLGLLLMLLTLGLFGAMTLRNRE